MAKCPWIAAFLIALLQPMCNAQSTQSTQNIPNSQISQLTHNTLSRGVLTNRDVVTLANAGFSEAFIVELIKKSPQKFDVTAEALADLAQNGLTETVIVTIINAARTSQLPPLIKAIRSGRTGQPSEEITFGACRQQTSGEHKKGYFTFVCASTTEVK